MTPQPADDAARLRVLKEIVIRRTVAAAELPAAAGLAQDAVEAVVLELEREGAVARVARHVVATEQGEERLRAAAAERWPHARSDPAVGRWMERFDALNTRFLAQVSRWQLAVADGAPAGNDLEPRRDGAGLAGLEATVADMLDLLADCGGRPPGLDGYDERLRRALRHAAGGHFDYVSGVGVDSLHSVWFEMHETLLIVLGRRRTT